MEINPSCMQIHLSLVIGNTEYSCIIYQYSIVIISKRIYLKIFSVGFQKEQNLVMSPNL